MSKVGCVNTGQVTTVGQGRGDYVLGEVNQSLCRGYQFTSTRFEGFLLYGALEAHARKCFVFLELLYIFLFNVHHDATVGVGVIALRGRPAIDHHFTRSGGSRRNNASRTHTEREYTLPLHLLHQAIRCRWKVLAAYITVVLGRIDQGLRVLYAYAQGKGLEMDLEVFIVQ